MKFFSVAFLACAVSATLTDDVQAVLDYAADLLGPGKANFSSAVALIMQNPLVVRVFDDLSNSNHTTEANEELLDHVNEALTSVFGSTNTSYLLAEITRLSATKFDNSSIDLIMNKASEQIGTDLNWVVPSLLEDEKLQNKTAELQNTLDVALVQNKLDPSTENFTVSGLIQLLSVDPSVPHVTTQPLANAAGSLVPYSLGLVCAVAFFL